MATIPSDQAFQRTYNSLSGVDIKAVFHNKAVVPLQAISYAIQREKAPVYTLGHPEPRAFSRGKRGIAGTLIFAMFDRHELIAPNQGIFKNARVFVDKEEVRPSTTAEGVLPGAINNQVETVGDEAEPFGELSPTNADDIAFDQSLQAPWYVDQIPPFNITLTGANELGALMVMRIYGVEILNEGYGISIDDLLSELQMTYVCRSIAPWTYYGDERAQQVTLG